MPATNHDAITRSTFPYCGVGCGVEIDGAKKLTGDKLHQANFGRLCSKGEALADTLDYEGKLLYPHQHRQLHFKLESAFT